MRFLTSAILTCVTASGLSLAAQTSPSQAAAVRADDQWLRLIDSSEYQEAWEAAANMMQAASPEPEFAKSVQGARKPLGAPVTRVLKSAETKTQLPGAPDGTYVVAQFTTHFAHKAEGVETVVTSQAPDGSWQVCGYFIR